MKAAIYCRVSTDNQEREGTSLQTQLEYNRDYCKNKGYEVSHRFSEAFSGLTLDRPELNKLRELIRAESIDLVVCYSLDRISRDPTHGVLLMQELEKHNVTLECVTEDVDNSDLGNLISYIRGYASKLEAEKIKERTTRGKRAAKEAGRIFTGSGIGVYGYDYLKRIKGERQASRVINDTEATWVKQIFEWLLNEGLSINAIVYRLRAAGAPTKAGNEWGRSSVHKILRNQAYAGRSNATPAIIDSELFDNAQKQLRANLLKSPRNTKYQYLLRGHIRCKQCGKSYTGDPHRGKTYYRCLGRRRINPVKPCHNKIWQADILESAVWNEIVNYLSDRDLILSELEREKQTAARISEYETELTQIERQMKSLDRDQHQLLQWALKGFPEKQVENENKRLNKAKETLTARQIELAGLIRACQNAEINIPRLESFITGIQDKLPSLDFEGKRLALEWLNITVWIDGENVNVTGVIEPEMAIRTTSTSLSECGRTSNIPFSLKI